MKWYYYRESGPCCLKWSLLSDIEGLELGFELPYETWTRVIGIRPCPAVTFVVMCVVWVQVEVEMPIIIIIFVFKENWPWLNHPPFFPFRSHIWSSTISCSVTCTLRSTCDFKVYSCFFSLKISLKIFNLVTLFHLFII